VEVGVNEPVNKIGKQWAGRVCGTNTGNFYMELAENNGKLSGTLRFMDSAFGLVIYQINGSFSDKLKFTGKPIQAPQNVSVGDLEVEGILNAQGHLQGSWKTVLGTAGTFTAFPHDIAPPQATPAGSPLIPEQMHIKNISLGAVRLFLEDVKQLFSHIKQDFVSGRLIVTYNSRGSEITKYADEFLREAPSLGTLEYLKATIQEHEAYGINRVVVVELRAFGQNEIRVQGVQESWVVGKAETLAAILRHYQSPLVTTYKKFGLGLNQFVFLGMLVVMPSITTLQNRVVFAIAVFALLTFMLWLHARFIPNASIKMSIAQPTWLARTWPSLISWLGAVTASLIAALIFYWLTKSPPP
jgi:hypothetical protein